MADRGREYRINRGMPAPEGHSYEHEALWTAGQLMLQAEEHILTFARAIEEGETFSPWTLARAALELLARAWWLLDPSVEADVRAARVVATRRYSHHREAELLTLLEEDSTDAKSSRDRADRELDTLGHDRLRIPRATDLTEDVLVDTTFVAGGAPYKLLSAMNHGTTFAALQVMQPVEEEDEDDPPPPGGIRVLIDLPPSNCAAIASPFVIAYDRCVAAWLSAAESDVRLWTTAIAKAGALVNELAAPILMRDMPDELLAHARDAERPS